MLVPFWWTCFLCKSCVKKVGKDMILYYNALMSSFVLQKCVHIPTHSYRHEIRLWGTLLCLETGAVSNQETRTKWIPCSQFRKNKKQKPKKPTTTTTQNHPTFGHIQMRRGMLNCVWKLKMLILTYLKWVYLIWGCCWVNYLIIWIITTWHKSVKMVDT